MGRDINGLHYNFIKLEGKDSFFVVVDRLIKYAHFCGTQSTYTVIQVVEVFLKEI